MDKTFVDTLFDGLIYAVETGENLDGRWFIRNAAYLATKTTANTADDVLVRAIDKFADVCGSNGDTMKKGIEWLRGVVKGTFSATNEPELDELHDELTTIAVACGDANWQEAA